MPLLSRKVRVSSLPYNFSIVLSVYISFCGNTKNPGFTVQSKLSAQPEQLFSLHNLHTKPSVTTPRSPEMTLWFLSLIHISPSSTFKLTSFKIHGDFSP